MELLLKDILENLLLSLMILIASGLSYVIKQYIDKSKLEQKKELVAIAIRFVEQVYKSYNGEQKYNEAVKWLTVQFEKAGLKYTDEEMKALVESTLKQFKEEFAKQW